MTVGWRIDSAPHGTPVLLTTSRVPWVACSFRGVFAHGRWRFYCPGDSTHMATFEPEPTAWRPLA